MNKGFSQKKTPPLSIGIITLLSTMNMFSLPAKHPKQLFF
ncbi:MAG: hypothetical protein PARBA_02258 [Parabacteroides sp.]